MLRGTRATAISATIRSTISTPVTTTIIATTIPAIATWFAARLTARFRISGFARPFGQYFTLVNPSLNSNHAVGGVCLRKTVINVGAQSVQRQLAVQIPLAAGDFGAIEAARYANLDSLATETLRRIHRLAHGAAECHPLFQLQGDRLRHQLSIKLRLVNFLNIDENFAARLLVQIAL